MFGWIGETISSTFNYFYDYFAGKEAKIILLGLDCAGKTSFLSMMTRNCMSALEPTKNATSETFVLGNLTINAMDLGGHEAYRRIWGDFFYGIDGIIFIIDTAETDMERVEMSKNELHALLENEMLENVPIMILGNKIDKEGAVSESMLRTDMDLNPHTLETRKAPLEIFMVSIALKTNLAPAMTWFSSQI